MQQSLQFLIRHGYAVLFLWLLVEQAALPVPSVPVLVACGALARSGQLSPPLLMLTALAACLLADNLWFYLGRRSGGKVLKLLCRIALEPDSCVRRTENAFVRYGSRSLLVAKFLPGFNTVAAPLAGSAGIAWPRFLAFDCAGVLLWLTAYVGIGYLFSDQIESVMEYAAGAGRGLGALAIVLLSGWIARKYFERRRVLRELSMSRITAEELLERIQAGEDVLMVDLRGSVTDRERAIPGTVRIAAEELAERYREIPPDREIVLFCS